jgi:hypothetical protein
VIQGRALKCRVCPGVLILNAQSLRQHVSSKRHHKQLAAADEYTDSAEPVCYAEELESESVRVAGYHDDSIT